jgi:hypothetical protein
MEAMQLHSRIGPDGVLRLTLPFEPADADTDVLVTIAPIVPQAGSTWGSMLSDNFGTGSTAGPAQHPGKKEASASR